MCSENCFFFQFENVLENTNYIISKMCLFGQYCHDQQGMESEC